MADERTFDYVVNVTVVERGRKDRHARRSFEVRGEVEAPAESLKNTNYGAEAARLAVSEAAKRGHSGRLMGKAFDDAE